MFSVIRLFNALDFVDGVVRDAGDYREFFVCLDRRFCRFLRNRSTGCTLLVFCTPHNQIFKLERQTPTLEVVEIAAPKLVTDDPYLGRIAVGQVV